MSSTTLKVGALGTVLLAVILIVLAWRVANQYAVRAEQAAAAQQAPVQQKLAMRSRALSGIWNGRRCPLPPPEVLPAPEVAVRPSSAFSPVVDALRSRRPCSPRHALT